MEAVLLGTGGPVSDGRRTSSAAVVNSGGGSLLIDCGPGTMLRLAQAATHPRDLQAIMLTHLHMDHCLELPAVVFGAFLTGRKHPVIVVGPPGTGSAGEAFFKGLFPYLAPLAKAAAGADLKVQYVEVSGGPVEGFTGISVQASPVVHGKTLALAYRVSEKEKSITISGDTEPCEGLIQLAMGSDLLIHDCAMPDEQGPVPGHTVPSQLGEVATKARVAQVVLTHLFRNCQGHESEMVASVRKNFSGKVVVGEDLMRLPV